MRRVVCALILLAGCSKDPPGDGDPSADAAAGNRGDAADSPRGDAGPDGCLDQVPDDWGDNGPVASSQWTIDGSYTWFADMVPETERFQRLFISLHPETGVFPGAVEPGMYILEGDETDFSWCSACVYLAVDDDGSAPSVLYMAQSGKLRVDSVDTEIHGELESAVLTQIDVVYNGPSCEGSGEWPCGNSACSGGLCGVQRLVPDCTSAIDSLGF